MLHGLHRLIIEFISKIQCVLCRAGCHNFNNPFSNLFAQLLPAFPHLQIVKFIHDWSGGLWPAADRRGSPSWSRFPPGPGARLEDTIQDDCQRNWYPMTSNRERLTVMSTGAMEMSLTTRNWPQLFRCSFSRRKKFHTNLAPDKNWWWGGDGSVHLRKTSAACWSVVTTSGGTCVTCSTLSDGHAGWGHHLLQDQAQHPE